MYSVSDAYKKAMHAKVQRFRMTGTITDGKTEVSFSDDNILAGSFSITNQCSGNQELQIGQVYIGELDATFLNLSLTRYSLKGMQIKPVFGMRLSDGRYEDVPLGVYNIKEAHWTASGLVIKAYDNMSLLDKNCNTDQSTGSAYDMAQLAMKACGLELANSQAEIESLPNGKENLSLYAENDVETWRDLISWLAQTLGCNAMADREGKILFKPYNQYVVDALDPEHRFSGGSFSDFETRYTGLSCVNLADKMTKYYHVEEDTGLTYNLGTNPFLQYGVDETKDKMRTEILTALQQVDYVPFKCSLIGNPAYDLMDVFSFTDGIADGNKLFCMTKFTFHYNGSYEMEGVGENADLASAKSKSDKNISGLLSQAVEQGKLGIRTFTNASAYTVKSTDVKIISIQFASSEKNHMQFLGQAIIDITADQKKRSAEAAGTITVPIPVDEPIEAAGGSSGTDPIGSTKTTDVNVEVELPVEWTEDGEAVVTATYELNEEKVETFHPVQTWHSGKHTFPLYYPLEAVLPDVTNTFNVYLKIAGGSGLIDAGGIIATISGQAMAAESPWDGNIELEEQVSLFSMGGGMKTNGLKDLPGTVELLPIEKNAVSQRISGRFIVGGFSNVVEV